MDLFDYKAKEKLKKEAPLADRMRPQTLDEIVGQKDVVGEGSVLRRLIEGDDIPSMIFWGPPGTGKTTIARVIARMTKSRFVPISATSGGVADLRTAVSDAQEFLKTDGTRTIIFVDEIHRWNKAQQDSFLPHVEDGTVILIGATTENPSFEVNAALMSRCRVFVLKQLEPDDITTLLQRVIGDRERGFGDKDITFEDGVLEYLSNTANGDARSALGALEMSVKYTAESPFAPAELRRDRLADPPQGGGLDGKQPKMVHLRQDTVAKVLLRSHLYYDKSGEEHYNIISALHKSMRGGDVDASLYWLGRMLEAGEDPLFVARRLVRFASEDIGLADPQALVQANAAFQAARYIGMPECDVCLAQAAAYLAKAPKSNELYVAYGRVKDDVRDAANEPVPLHLRNAPTRLMKDLDYSKGYIYTPEDPEARQGFMPERLRGRKYYRG